MKSIIVFLFVFAAVNLFGQGYNCGTKKDSAYFVNMPHYGNNAILQDVLNITRQRDNARSTLTYPSNGFRFNIPVKIWIYHNDDGTNVAVSESDVDNFIIEANNHFNNNDAAGIRFYKKCAYTHINSSEFNTVNSDAEFINMIATHRDPKALNWHFIRDVDYPNPDDNWGGKARFPDNDYNFSFVIQKGSNLWMETTIVHEIGHTLGLLHTHESKRTSESNNGDVGNECDQESVSRARKNWIERGCWDTHKKLKCEINGDVLCDTEASPRSLTSDLSGCTYTGTEKDLWGDTFTPPVNNFMSYTSSSCRSEFTPGQIGVMHLMIVLLMAEGGWPLPGVNGEPWYNKNILSLSGVSNSGDIETYVASERIEVAPDGSYAANSGSDVTLIAQNKIILNPGFAANTGSYFAAKAEAITDCGSITVGSAGQLNASYVSNTRGNDEEGEHTIESKIIALYLASKEKNELEDSTDKPVSITQGLSLYPNPTDGRLNISYSFSEAGQYAIEIYSLQGKLKFRQEITEGNTQLDISELGSGMYLANFIEILNGEKRVFTEKVAIYK